MARTRRGSSVLDSARQRLAGLKSITPAPDLGPALTLTGYEQEITAFSTSLDGYNEKLAALDELQNSLEAAETSLRDKNKRILSAVEAAYGSDSSEYEQVGGTRQSDRKRPTGRPSTRSLPCSGFHSRFTVPDLRFTIYSVKVSEASTAGEFYPNLRFQADRQARDKNQALNDGTLQELLH